MGSTSPKPSARSGNGCAPTLQVSSGGGRRGRGEEAGRIGDGVSVAGVAVTWVAGRAGAAAGAAVPLHPVAASSSATRARRGTGSRDRRFRAAAGRTPTG
mgnify:CR=1 FL=1